MIGNREERRGREDGKQEKEREKEGEGRQKGKWHVQSSYETCSFPLILEVNVTPIAVMSFLRCSRASSV